MITIETKSCLECGSHFHGRADKKFCSDLCRSAYNNNLELRDRDYVRRVHYVLKKNRKILTRLMAEGCQDISTDTLRVKGFDFTYCTNYYTGKDGTTYFYCYDLGFSRREEEGKLILLEKQLS